MSEIDRLYQYKSLLSSRRVMSREDVLHKLEISLATFKRDIAKLHDRLHTPSYLTVTWVAIGLNRPSAPNNPYGSGLRIIGC